MIKVGDIIIYNPEKPELAQNRRELTIGEKYIVVDIDVDWVSFLNNRGERHSTWVKYFETISDIRDKKIDKILK
jgi:hypothetical protein